MATISNQWYQVADNAQAQIEALSAQRLLLEEKIRAWRAAGNPAFTSPDYSEFSSLGNQIAQLQQTVTDAREKGSQALSSEKNGSNSIPAPVATEINVATSLVLNQELIPKPVGTESLIPKPVGTESVAIDAPAVTTSPNNDHGLPYDDNGNLMPGWSLTEDNDPVWVGGDFVEPSVANSAAKSFTNATGITRALTDGNKISGTTKVYAQEDWRVRLSLAGSANYLYRIADKTNILYPLIATDGVIFPYSPVINSSYRANYDPAELTHSNYKMFFYKNSSVDDISITADFTAQDTAEANYMLAVIHFFKSATKMFYGKDTDPRAGTPPPLLYLTGYGLHQFQKHPLLLTNFSYNLPNDVDYIRAGSNSQWGGISIAQLSTGTSTRLSASGLTAGGATSPPTFAGLSSKDEVTYVPTKISLTLTLVPVVTRNDISKNFSLKDYAAGTLSAKTGGGIW